MELHGPPASEKLVAVIFAGPLTSLTPGTLPLTEFVLGTTPFDGDDVLSINVSGTAPQFSATNGFSRRMLSSWISEATSSLPVPLSP